MTFLLLWSLRSAGVILLGLGLCFALRRRSAAVRSLGLRATLTAAWLVPLTALFAPQIEVPVAAPVLAPREAPPMVERSVGSPTSPSERWSVVQADPQDVGSVGLVRQAPTSSFWVPVVNPLLVLWALGAGFLVLRWLVAFMRLRRIARRGQRVEPPSPLAPLPRRGEGEVLLADVSVPMTYGRTILMPRESVEWPEARVRAALLHEAAHVRRGDWAWQTLAGSFCAVHWMNPLAWALAHTLRANAEAAADDEAIREMAPSDYAQALLDVAVNARPSGPALAMARYGGVAHRIREILSFRDRRGPSRGMAAFALALSTLTGIGVAGTTLRQALTKPSTSLRQTSEGHPLRTGGSLRLVALHEGRQAWRPDGERLPERTETDSFHPSQGRRGVTFEFERVGSAQPSGLGILTRDFLHQTGKPTLLVDTPDEVQMIAPFPRNSSSSTGDEGSKVGPTGVMISHPTFTRELDPKLETTDVLVRLSSGLATVSKEPVRVLKTERLTRSASIDGKWYPGVSIRALVPKALRHETVLLRAFDAKGLMIEGSSPVAPFPDGTVTVTYDVANPSEIARLQWAHRRPEFVEIKGVRLRPGAVAQPEETKHPVELIGLWEGDRVWRASGARDLKLSTVDFRKPSRPGWRRVGLAFRVLNAASLADDRTIRATVWSKYAYPSDASVFRGSYRPNELIAYVSIPLRMDVKVAKIGVDLFGGPWRQDADATPGTGSGQATVWRNGVSRASDGTAFNEYEVAFNGLNPPGRDRYAELQTFNARGELRNTYVGALPFGPHGGYHVGINAPNQPGRFVLRSRAIEHFRFDNVRLRPGMAAPQDQRNEGRLTVRVERAPRFVGSSKWTLYVRLDGRAPVLDRPYRLVGYDAKGVPQLTKVVPAARGKAWISTNVVLKDPEEIVHWTLISAGKDASRWESRP